MDERITKAIEVLAPSSAFSSIAGLSALLKAKVPLTLRNIAAAMLYSGVLGFIVGSWLYTGAPDENVTKIWCVSAAAGVGGVTVADLFITIFKAFWNGGGIQIVLSRKKDED